MTKHTLALEANQRGLARRRAAAEAAAQHRASIERLRQHPLAMDPATVKNICARRLSTLKPSPDIIKHFSSSQAPSSEPSPEGGLEKAALEYLRTPSPPNGYAKLLALRHGVNYGSLLTKISVLRCRHRFA